VAPSQCPFQLVPGTLPGGNFEEWNNVLEPSILIKYCIIIIIIDAYNNYIV